MGGEGGGGFELSVLYCSLCDCFLMAKLGRFPWGKPAAIESRYPALLINSLFRFFFLSFFPVRTVNLQVRVKKGEGQC